MSNKYQFDVGAQSLVKAEGAAVTATETNSVDYKLESCPTFAVVIDVTAVDRANSDETYEFSVQSLDAAGANTVELGALVSITTAGQYVVAIDGSTAKKLAGDSDEKIQLTATLGGTTPSLTYSAHIQRAQ